MPSVLVRARPYFKAPGVKPMDQEQVSEIITTTEQENAMQTIPFDDAVTRSRLRTVPIVLAVQDTTYLNWEHHPAIQGLGRLSDAGRGIICHSTLAVTPKRLPLLIRQEEVIMPRI